MRAPFSGRKYRASRQNVSVTYPAAPSSASSAASSASSASRSRVVGVGARSQLSAKTVGVPGAVDRGDVTAPPLQLLRHPGGAGEEVEGGAAAGGGEQRTDHVDQAALGAQVLDRHGRRRYPRIVATLRRRERRRRPERGRRSGGTARSSTRSIPARIRTATATASVTCAASPHRLDHLAWLGVRAIWLSPVTVSPNADFGYDVADYYDVTRASARSPTSTRSSPRPPTRGIGVLMDLVPNHTSDQHPWFEMSRSSRDNPKRDWYVWADPAPDGGPPNNWVSVFGGPAWTLDDVTGQYYLHNFLDEQPDLNWWSEEVRDQFDRILRYWFDPGVGGSGSTSRTW